MCQPKSRGGRRCAVHRYGSNASIRTTEALANAPKEIVLGAFKDLRKEGEKLPEPDKLEVVEFAVSEKFKVKYNPDIPERVKNVILKNWDKEIQGEDVPNGATFYAWKNMTSETMKRLRGKFGMAVASFGVATLVAACSAGGSLEGQDNYTPTPPNPTSTSSPVDPTTPPVPGEDTPFGDWSEGDRAKAWESYGASIEDHAIVLGDETITDKYGTYVPLEIDVSKLSEENTTVYDDENYFEAREAAAEFISKVGLDSILTWDYSPENAAKVFEENKSLVHPEWVDSFQSSLDNKQEGISALGLIDLEGYLEASPSSDIYSSNGSRWIPVSYYEYSTNDIDHVAAQRDQGRTVISFGGTVATNTSDGAVLKLDFSQDIVLERDSTGEFKVSGWRTTIDEKEATPAS